jgi:NAD(P)H-hydrate repair Nnr-like enzyme with NAD(P)H-hydrate dehydratase domain
MPDTPEFSPDEEEKIQQKKEEFQNAVEEHKKRHPSGVLGINPGNDPIAREAMIRLMEKNIEQALASQSEQALDADALQKIRADVCEQVNALFARNTTT